jgi:hypothetical protein
VLADFMPLVPDRWLNVTHTRDPRVRQVNVFGHAYSSSSSHEEARRAPSMSLRQLDGTVIEVRAPDVASSSVLEVWVERLNVALGEDFGWQREAGAVVRRATRGSSSVPSAEVSRVQALARGTDLLHYREFTALVDEGLLEYVFVTPRLWEGTVRLPDAPGEGARYRLAIAEYEEYLVDDATPYDRIPTSKGRRLVFVEYLELD